MDTLGLEQRLKDEGFRSDCFDFVGDDTASETLVLRREGRGWAVYYAERGLQTGKQLFGSEAEGCEYFYGLISRDPTTKQK